MYEVQHYLLRSNFKVVDYVVKAMPNGKGSPEWGWMPSFEEIAVAIVTFLAVYLPTKSFFLAISVALVSGLLMLWNNNGRPWIK